MTNTAMKKTKLSIEQIDIDHHYSLVVYYKYNSYYMILADVNAIIIIVVYNRI